MTYEVRKGWTQREWLVVEAGEHAWLVCRTYSKVNANLIAEALNELVRRGSRSCARTGTADGEKKA